MTRRETTISLPELALIAGTRGILGVGIGLLTADRFTRDQRKAVGWALFTVGAITSIPLALEIFEARRVVEADLIPESKKSRAA